MQIEIKIISMFCFLIVNGIYGCKRESKKSRSKAAVQPTSLDAETATNANFTLDFIIPKLGLTSDSLAVSNIVHRSLFYEIPQVILLTFDIEGLADYYEYSLCSMDETVCSPSKEAPSRIFDRSHILNAKISGETKLWIRACLEPESNEKGIQDCSPWQTSIYKIDSTTKEGITFDYTLLDQNEKAKKDLYQRIMGLRTIVQEITRKGFALASRLPQPDADFENYLVALQNFVNFGTANNFAAFTGNRYYDYLEELDKKLAAASQEAGLPLNLTNSGSSTFAPSAQIAFASFITLNDPQNQLNLTENPTNSGEPDQAVARGAARGTTRGLEEVLKDLEAANAQAKEVQKLIEGYENKIKSYQKILDENKRFAGLADAIDTATDGITDIKEIEKIQRTAIEVSDLKSQYQLEILSAAILSDNIDLRQPGAGVAGIDYAQKGAVTPEGGVSTANRAASSGIDESSVLSPSKIKALNKLKSASRALGRASLQAQTNQPLGDGSEVVKQAEAAKANEVGALKTDTASSIDVKQQIIEASSQKRISEIQKRDFELQRKSLTEEIDKLRGEQRRLKASSFGTLAASAGIGLGLLAGIALATASIGVTASSSTYTLTEDSPRAFLNTAEQRLKTDVQALLGLLGDINLLDLELSIQFGILGREPPLNPGSDSAADQEEPPTELPPAVP